MPIWFVTMPVRVRVEVAGKLFDGVTDTWQQSSDKRIKLLIITVIFHLDAGK